MGARLLPTLLPRRQPATYAADVLLEGWRWHTGTSAGSSVGIGDTIVQFAGVCRALARRTGTSTYPRRGYQLADSDEWLNPIMAAAAERVANEALKAATDAEKAKRAKAEADKRAQFAKVNHALLERERARLLQVVQHAYTKLHPTADRDTKLTPPIPGIFRRVQPRGWSLDKAGWLTTTGHVLISGQPDGRRKLSPEAFVARVLDPT